MNLGLRLAKRAAQLPRWAHYLTAAAIVAVATLIRLALDPLLGYAHVFPIYLAAALAAGLVLNRSSATVALAVGALAGAYFFLEPRHSLLIRDLADWVALAIYLGAGGLVAAFAG